MKNILAIILSAVLASATLAEAAEQTPVDNIVILLDASGSMFRPIGNVPKIDAAKAALKEVLKNTPQSAHIGLLVFSAKNVKDWAYPLGPRDDAALTAAIDLPVPEGNTPLGTYMKMAADRLLKARKDQFGYGSYRLLVVTDGEANNEARNLVDTNAKDIISRGIIVDVIGVDMPTTHTLATKVHSYRKADDPEALRRAVKEVFAEVGKSAGPDVGDDAFEVITAIPDGLAAAVIDAFSSASNEPIGAKPRFRPRVKSTPPDQPVPAAGAAVAPAPQVPPAGPQKESKFRVGMYIFIAVLGFLTLRRIVRKARS